MARTKKKAALDQSGGLREPNIRLVRPLLLQPPRPGLDLAFLIWGSSKTKKNVSKAENKVIAGRALGGSSFSHP